MTNITYQYVKTATLNEREAALLISVGRIGGSATALQAIKAAHEDSKLVQITHSEIYALAKRLEAKGLMVRGEDAVELHGERLTRVVFQLTTTGRDCYAQTAPPSERQEEATVQTASKVAASHLSSSVKVRAGNTAQLESA